VAVVCIDGGDPAYIQRYLDEGAIPNIAPTASAHPSNRGAGTGVGSTRV